MILDLTKQEVAILDQWRNDIDEDAELFDTWEKFVDFVHECHHEDLNAADTRWVEREVARMLNIKFGLSAAYLQPQRIEPDNYPRQYHGKYSDTYCDGGPSVESLLRLEIDVSGYKEVIVDDLANE